MHDNTKGTLKGRAIPIPVPVHDDRFIFSPTMDYMIQTGTWILWGANAYRGWGESNFKDAMIIAGGLANLYATYKLIQK